MQFGSDNHTGASARVLEAIVASNLGHAGGYGSDQWSQRAFEAIAATFECDHDQIEVFFVATGTASNTLALACLVQPWQVILCHSQSHVLIDESTAPEHQSGGARPVGISGRAGKLTPAHLTDYFATAGSDAPHNARAGALTLSQSTELGLVYTPAELAALSEAARRHDLRVHMDGARFANAVVATGASPAELTWKSGIEVLSLGATKNGCLAAEAIIFFGGLRAAEQMQFRRKRAGHLLSKSRFFGAQFVGWLQDGHWLELAAHANASARRLADSLTQLPGVRLMWPVAANEVFAILPATLAQSLRAHGAVFYEWYADSLPAGTALGEGEVFARLVTSFATTDDHIDDLGSTARRLLGLA